MASGPLLGAGVKLTLQLLPGPTKLLVGSALAGVAADLVLGPPAHCASYHLLPYDDDVWQAERGSPKNGEGAPLPAAAAGAAKAAVKTKAKRPIGKTALLRIAGPRNIAITLARNELLSCVVVLHGYFEALSAEEDLADLQDREPNHVPFPAEAMKAAARRGLFNACIDWATQIVRSLLDWAASARLSIALSGKLVKDLKASVQRKSSQYTFLYRGVRVVKTSLLSEATLYLADFLVAVSMETALLVRARRKGLQGLPTDRQLRRLALRCGLHGVRCGAVLGGVSLANGVGSMVPYKRGLFMFLLAQLSSLGVNTVMYQWMDHLTGLPPPPAAPAAAAAATGGGAAAAAGADGPAAEGPVGEPLLMMNAQMARGAAAAVAGAALGVGGGEGAAGALPGAEEAVAEAAAGEQAALQAQRAQQAEAGPRAGAVGQGEEEPPVPVPQQRRPVVGGPNLPERPARRNHRAGPPGPPPQAPHTPQFREPRVPSPAPDSEDTEAGAAAAGGATPTSAPPPATAKAATPGEAQQQQQAVAAAAAGPSGEGDASRSVQAAGGEETAAAATAAADGTSGEVPGEPSGKTVGESTGDSVLESGGAAGESSGSYSPHPTVRASVELDREASAVLGES